MQLPWLDLGCLRVVLSDARIHGMSFSGYTIHFWVSFILIGSLGFLSSPCHFFFSTQILLTTAIGSLGFWFLGFPFGFSDGNSVIGASSFWFTDEASVREWLQQVTPVLSPAQALLLSIVFDQFQCSFFVSSLYFFTRAPFFNHMFQIFRCAGCVTRPNTHCHCHIIAWSGITELRSPGGCYGGEDFTVGVHCSGTRVFCVPVPDFRAM